MRHWMVAGGGEAKCSGISTTAISKSSRAVIVIVAVVVAAAAAVCCHINKLLAITHTHTLIHTATDTSRHSHLQLFTAACIAF